MSAKDNIRAIASLKTKAPATLALRWSDGVRAELDLAPLLRDKAFKALRDRAIFAKAKVGDWGHSVEWPSGVGLSAGSLWLETLAATGHADARAFLEWRMRHGLSLSSAADALGLSRRMVAYYSNGEKPVPRAIRLACRGWEADQAA